MNRTALAKKVAASYMRQLSAFRTDIKDHEGFPTFVQKLSPAEDGEEMPTDIRPPTPQGPSNKVVDDSQGVGFMTPVVPDDAIRR